MCVCTYGQCAHSGDEEAAGDPMVQRPGRSLRQDTTVLVVLAAQAHPHRERGVRGEQGLGQGTASEGQRRFWRRQQAGEAPSKRKGARAGYCERLVEAKEGVCVCVDLKSMGALQVEHARHLTGSRRR